ncbi:MAG: DUF1292 domain-containing protein [Solobacterium sp.]|nr:DUF1292 domain-containing protein [Solobacterium sp.]
METDNVMTIIDDEGNERNVEILLTFESEETGKQYVLFSDPDDEDSVYAYTYTDDGELNSIDDEDVEMCEEVFQEYLGIIEDGK